MSVSPGSNGQGKSESLPEVLLPLTKFVHWVIWRKRQKKDNPDKFDKIPYQPRRPDAEARTNDPSTWGTYAEAVAAAQFADGIGFVLTDSDFPAFDLDGCRNSETEELHPWAANLITQANSYTEITPSGTGVRIIGRGTGKHLHKQFVVIKGMEKCELYRKATRFIAITGNHINNVPLADIDAIMDATFAELEELKRNKPGSAEDGGQHSKHIDLEDVIEHGRYELFLDEGGRPDKSRAVWFVINESIRQGKTDDEIAETLLNRENEISRHNYDAHPGNPERYVRDQIADARKQTEARIVPVVDHMRRARLFRAARYPNLRHWRGDFYDWVDTSHFQEIDKDTIKAEIWKYLDQALCRNDEGKIVRFYPQKRSVEETFAALAAISQIRDNIETPFWLDGGIAGELIAFPNGLLDLDSDKFHPPNPNYFTLGALGFKYEPKRGEPMEWLGFLDQIYNKQDNPTDAEAQIATLQETFGYLLTGDISQEKCFLWLGPPRSGKGTMGHMIYALLASTAVTGPKLSDFGSEFGLSLLIGKQVAIIDDLRVGRSDQNLMVENVLKITGRGLFTINRKYKSFWNGLLPVKLVFISNKMPQLGDDSPALANRFIILETRQSFLGREDPNLFKTKTSMRFDGGGGPPPREEGDPGPGGCYEPHGP